MRSRTAGIDSGRRSPEPGFGMKDPARRERAVATCPEVRFALVEQLGDAMALDLLDRLPVGAGRAAIGAHLPPRPLQDVPAVNLVLERVETSPAIGLGHPVERSLQFSGAVCRGGNSHAGHSPNLSLHVTRGRSSGPPLTRVVLSRGLERYYGRLGLPPGSPAVSRSAVIDQRCSGALRRRRAGEGLPSSRRHLPSVPRPLRREVPRGCVPGSSPLPWSSP